MTDVKKKPEEPSGVDIKISDFKAIVDEAVAKHSETLQRRQKAVNYGGNETDKKLLEETEKRSKTLKFLNAISTNDVISLSEIHNERAKALNETTGSAGGYLVPEEFEADVMRYMNDYSELRRNALVVPMTRKVKRLNTLTTDPTVYYTGESTQKSSTSLVFGEPVLTARKICAIVPWTDELFEDAEINLINLITERLAQKIAYTEQNEFVNGTTGGSEGLLQVAGTTGITLNSGTTFSNLTWDDLADMEASLFAVSKSESKTAKYYMSMTAYNILRQLKSSTAGNYFVTPAVPSSDMPATAWGKEIVVLNEFPTSTATGTKFVVYSDLSKHLVIGDRSGIAIKVSDQAIVGSDNLYELDETALRVVKRTANCVALANGVVTLATN